MATIGNDPNGRKRILFVAPDGKRKTVRLGKVSRRQAEAVKLRVEALNAALISRCPIDGDTAAWVAGIGDGLAKKLAAVGLIPERAAPARLGEFLESYAAGRTDVKRNTQLNYAASRGRLLAFFGADRPLRDITEGDADAWLCWLKQRYAQATASRAVRHARQFFRAAVRQRLIPSNPFADVKAGVQTNAARMFFVSREVAAKVLDACPDGEWRLIVVLCRYGGIRCPSELLPLRWQDVDWANDQFWVTSPKTEHHEGGAGRWVPIFPELRAHLEEAFERAEPGAVYLINRYRTAGVNLRTQLMRILRRAGLKPWPRLFQNLRSSRETELAAVEPLHCVVAWLGNSARVAAAHYLQVTPADVKRAAQTPAQSAAEGGCQGGTGGPGENQNAPAFKRCHPGSVPDNPLQGSRMESNHHCLCVRQAS
jgi:integrase